MAASVGRPQVAAADAGQPDRDAAAQGLDHPTPADHHGHMPARRAIGAVDDQVARAGAGPDAGRPASWPAAVRGMVTPAARQAAQVSPEQSNAAGPSAPQR